MMEFKFNAEFSLLPWTTDCFLHWCRSYILTVCLISSCSLLLFKLGLKVLLRAQEPGLLRSCGWQFHPFFLQLFQLKEKYQITKYYNLYTPLTWRDECLLTQKSQSILISQCTFLNEHYAFENLMEKSSLTCTELIFWRGARSASRIHL